MSKYLIVKRSEVKSICLSDLTPKPIVGMLGTTSSLSIVVDAIAYQLILGVDINSIFSLKMP